MDDTFYTINRLPPYIFAAVNEAKMNARRKGEDIIDQSMGNPDIPTPDAIVEKLCEAAHYFFPPQSHNNRGKPGLF